MTLYPHSDVTECSHPQEVYAALVENTALFSQEMSPGETIYLAVSIELSTQTAGSGVEGFRPEEGDPGGTIQYKHSGGS